MSFKCDRPQKGQTILAYKKILLLIGNLAQFHFKNTVEP